MPLPRSFQSAGYTTVNTVRKKRRLMIGTDGLTNSGKTEFLMSCPEPIIIVALDRSFDSALDNPNPPEWRNEDGVAFDVVKIPTQGQGTKSDYGRYFNEFRNHLYAAIDNPDSRTVCIDGDSDSWELQLLAEFERTTQIPPLYYQAVDATRRAIINRCWDAGKIIVGTNKIKDKYVDVLDEEGKQIIDEKSHKPKQIKLAGEYKRQGFRDQDYLWQLQLRHLYKPTEKKVVLAGPRKGHVLSTTPPQWGLRILKCKVNPLLDGDELWGDSCNFDSLVQHVYPHVPVEDWKK